VVDHAEQELARAVRRRRAHAVQRAGDARGLQSRQLRHQGLALGRGEKKTLPPVVVAGLLDNIALVEKLFQNTPERLLGDPQHVEQIGDLQARITGHEMDHAVVGAAKPELLQHVIGVADEVPVGEKQQFDNVPALLAEGRGGAGPLLGGNLLRTLCFEIYVRHIDISWVQYYKKTKLHEIFGCFVPCGTRMTLRQERPAGYEANFSAARLSVDIPRNILDLTAHDKRTSTCRLLRLDWPIWEKSDGSFVR